LEIIKENISYEIVIILIMIGDWGLGIAQSPIPNPQSPIPNINLFLTLRNL